MSNILIVYGSTTGNTEMAAEQIANHLEAHEPEMKDVADIDPEELTQCDVLITGASTWGDGVLQDDFKNFVEDLEIDLTDKKLAAFGLGDSSYPAFCKSAGILQETFTELGAEAIVEPLEIDGFPDEEENEQQIEEWCEQIEQKLS